MNIVGVIPSRFASTRYPGKPLALIAGRPMIAWVIESEKKAKNLNQIILATDHLEIARVGENLGVKVVMTDSSLPSGTDRIHAALKNEQYDVAVNIQGDEPLLDPLAIDELASVFSFHAHILMATLAHSLDENSLRNPNTVKVLINQKSHAVYFSRASIPFTREPPSKVPCWSSQVLHHIGIYAYRKELLRKLCNTPPGIFEIGEGLEQLRALDLGEQIFVKTVDYRSMSVDTPEDRIRIEDSILLKAGR